MKSLRSAPRQAAIALRRLALLGYRRLLRPRVVRHAGVNLAIGDHLSPIIVDYIYGGDYEKSELKAIRANLSPDDVVLEVGTGIGFIALQCARVVGGDRVFSFEANPALEPHIRRNFELNRLFPTLEIALLGDRAGEADFFVEDDLWASSAIGHSGTARRVKVPTKPLNDVVRRIDPTFLILDIEGGESDFFERLDPFHITKVAMELHEPILGPEKVERVRQRLRDAGFTIDPRYTKGDQLFARRAARDTEANR